MSKSPKKFRTRNSSSDFWKGFARQTIDFQAAIGELIDNSLSARLPKPVGDGLQDAVVEITLHEQDNGTIRMQVADAGTGVTWDDLTSKDNIFNLGYRPSKVGEMNEHGFGLKNALALLTSGFVNEFWFYSRSHGSSGELFLVKGPLGEEMEAESASPDRWADDLSLLAEAPSGVKVIADVNGGYFQTLYRRGQTFETLVERLAEHLGVMYSHRIEQGDQLRLRYRSRKAAKWTERDVPSIPTPLSADDLCARLRKHDHGRGRRRGASSPVPPGPARLYGEERWRVPQ